MNRTAVKFLTVTIVVSALAFLTFRPIINPQREDCFVLEGPLKDPFAAEKNQDIYFELENSDKHFRLNRGMEAGLNQKLLDSIEGKIVTIYPVEHWTLLDPYNDYPHVARMEIDGKVLYSEF